MQANHSRFADSSAADRVARDADRDFPRAARPMDAGAAQRASRGRIDDAVRRREPSRVASPPERVSAPSAISGDVVRRDRPRRPSLGPARLAGALRYSLAGLRHAALNEAAFQQELIGLSLLTPIALWLPLGALERALLILSMLFVLVVELLNSAVEATVDRISVEHHPLSGQAKDLGSAAVLVALAMSGIAWLVVAGPIVASWVVATARAFA